MGLFNKKELLIIEAQSKEIMELKRHLESLGGMEYIEVVEKSKLLLEKYEEKEKELDSLNTQLEENKKILDEIMIDIEMSEFGIYTPKYNMMSSEEYKLGLNAVRAKQKELIKNKTALSYSDNWQLEGSKAKGKALNNDNMKMYLRAYNNECDMLISKVKFNNVSKIEEKIKKLAIALDKLNARNKISLLPGYAELKMRELHLVHEYAVCKQEEKEANRQAREEEREHQKMIKEIEAARTKIKKEQTHYEQAREKINEQLKTADDSMRQELESKLEDINNTLGEITKNLDDVDYREANNRAGYVYVISNIGSFGENVYKIGMTRRLEPQDRVDELGDASVPFRFDVHAMIFSDDAPKLENALHTAFNDKKVNMVNGRKEFFNVTIKEIEQVIRENHDKSIEFKEIPEADQYRESIKLSELTV